MNRNHFQQLAEDRLKDAHILLENRRFDAAYYLAGYAVECALKACISKLTKRYDFPPKDTKDVYGHDFAKLMKFAGVDRSGTGGNKFRSTSPSLLGSGQGLERDYQIR